MITSPPDWAPLGQRIQAARVALGLTPQSLADAAKLTVPELMRMEAGHHEFGPSELARIAAALEVGVDWFFTEPPPTVRSLRTDRVEGPRIARFDLRLDVLARDVELLRSIGFLVPRAAERVLPPPANIDATEQAAQTVRTWLDAETGPLVELDRLAEKLGVHTLCLRLGNDEPDGSHVALDGGGVVLINGAQPTGSRRFTLAHELGHHVFQDPYSTDWLAAGSHGTELVINAFAAHLLFPRSSVVAEWHRLARTHEPRHILLMLAVEYRVSWSLACAQCSRFRLIDRALYELLAGGRPSQADLVELGLHITEELTPPSLSPGFARAVLSAYRKNRISSGRAIEMLRGTLQLADLPSSDEVPLQAYLSELEAP